MSSQRVAYGQALVELGESNPRVVVLEADLGKSTMSYQFGEAYPQRYFEMGIAEANMTSFAAGLALSGKIPFTNSFAAFAAGRAYDQIRQSVCAPGLGVKICGSSAGLSDYGDGGSHQTVEDIAIMRAIPNMTVLVPMDAREARLMTFAAAELDGPVYLRISRSDLPDQYPREKRFVLGEYPVLREGRDCALLACGGMVSRALEAAELLAAQGIQARVVNVSTLKPFGSETIRALCRDVPVVVTAEEHSRIGGLGSAVSDALRGMPVAQDAVAIDDLFGESAQSEELLMAHYGLTSQAVCDRALAQLGKL